MSNVTPVIDAADAVPEPSRLAALLRWLGTGAVALSGIVFLLQGFEDMDALLRNWSYLLLMGLLAASGVATRLLFDDPRSARLLLGLAVALIPVQFAQLGGMLHTLSSGEVVDPGSWFGFAALSPAMVLSVGLATLAAAPLIAYVGFAVLVRPAARRLAWVFLLPNVLLLLPARDSIGGYAVLALLGLLVPAIDAYLGSLKTRFATPEGRAVRAMLLIPAAIATARLGFHVDELAGFCTLAGFWSAALIYTARCQVDLALLREIMYLAAASIAGFAWLTWVMLGMDAGSVTPALVLVPSAALLGSIGRLSTLSVVYRMLAATAGFAGAASLLFVDGFAASLACLALGAALVVLGGLQRDRYGVYAGSAAIAGGMSVLCAEAWHSVDVSSWISLAIAGLVLVVCASLVERYGRSAIGRVRAGLAEVQGWE